MPPVAFAVIVTVCPFVIAVALIVEAFLSVAAALTLIVKYFVLVLPFASAILTAYS